MNFIPYLVVFCFATVLARTDDVEYDETIPEATPLEEATFMREFFNCDGEKEKGIDDQITVLNKCIKQIDTNKKISDLTRKCYPGMLFPVSAKDTRSWYCDRSPEEIVEAVECENTEIIEMDSDEDSALPMTLQMCIWDAMPCAEESGESNEEKESDEDGSEEHKSGEEDEEDD